MLGFKSLPLSLLVDHKHEIWCAYFHTSIWDRISLKGCALPVRADLKLGKQDKSSLIEGVAMDIRFCACSRV